MVTQELTERSALLAQLDGLSLHDDDQQQGAFKKAGTLGGRSYAQTAARWRATFETFWYEARWLEGAIAAMARRYLGGEPLLFPEDTEALDRTLRSLRSLGSLFNEHVAAPLQQLTAPDAAVELGDNNALTKLITERSAYLVDRAKAEKLHLWQGRSCGDAAGAVGVSGGPAPRQLCQGKQSVLHGAVHIYEKTNLWTLAPGYPPSVLHGYWVDPD